MTEQATATLDPRLRDQICAARSLPSPPAIAVRLIELGDDPDVGLEQLVEVLRPDPALTARLLRLANSPLYAQRRRVETLHQAVVLLGMDAVFTAALSLTIVSDRRALGSSSLSLRDQWTRSVTAAISAQFLARHCGGVAPGDAFLAGLVQDIGILALGRVAPHVYLTLGADSVHDDFVACEVEAIGSDHAEVGALLLEAWRLPAHIVDAVARSHQGGTAGVTSDRLANLVAIGALISDAMRGQPEKLVAATGAASTLLGIDQSQFSNVLDEIATALPSLAPVLDVDVPPADVLAELAAEAIFAREARRHGEFTRIQENLAGLTEIARRLELTTRTDSLTGLINRRHLDEVMEREFERAKLRGDDLAVLFIDLDDFKSVNDEHGHQAGDSVLRWAADQLVGALRSEDIVGRYAGDEFVVVLPAMDGARAEAVARRLLDVFEQTSVEIGPEVELRQTVTIGVAALEHDREVGSASQLLRAADSRLIEGKRIRRAAIVAQP